MTRTAGSTIFVATLVLTTASTLLAQRPNPTNTPGAKTKANDAQVCAADFTASIKPVSNYQRADALKRYGRDPGSYTGEVDHLIPPALGGSNDPDNLWPMPDNKEYGIAAKRELETTLHQMVCDKKIPLKEAQEAIRKDWTKAYDQYVKNKQ